ncbi:MAG: Stk1 family PASTA domain-containing Ser/Thr kinase [Actinomycetales bacterium]|nr:Stk1 family PASTA domain-containing Ser/Thr kinase [Actinomycetales bacterium]
MAQDDTRILAGRYQVGELIGRGGMAEVHIGHDTRLGRTVAIKVLRSDLARDPSFQARFRREAQAAAALNHPAIVAVYDTGEDVFVDPNGVQQHVPFIVMEYVEGHTVRDILRDGHAVPIEEAIEIVVGVLSALEYSHHAGIVHRDIKPANVMLTPTGAVKVMDFGIARAIADSGATMTQTQAVIGTAQYLSPEQARGETVDTRSDLYSTGCLLFELLTGRAPFVGDSPVSVAYQHVREAAPVPSSLASDVPEVLDRITLKALAKDRESRYANAADFRADLETAVRGGVVSAPPAAAYAAGATTLTPVVEDVPAPAATQVFTPQPPATAPTQAFTPGTGMPWAPTQPGALGTGTGATPLAVDDDDDEGSRPWIMWTLIGVAVAAVIGIVLLFVLPDREPPAPADVAIPPLTEMTQEQATEKLESVGLRAKFLQEPSDEIAVDLVTRSDPPAGDEVAPDTEISVYLSTGPSEFEIPDVAGETQERAIEILTDAGLRVSRTDTADVPGTKENEAVSTDPPAGTAAKEGDSVVLTVATGLVLLEDLVGVTEEEAIALLEDLQLSYRVETEETDAVEPGQVARQSRGPGLVPFDARIEIYVAVEPAPTTAVIPDDIVGKQFEDARDQLEALDLRVRSREEESDQAPGTVLYSEPGVGSEVDLNSIVTLVIAKAPPPPEPDPEPDPDPPPGDGGEEGGEGDALPGQSAQAATPWQPSRPRA